MYTVEIPKVACSDAQRFNVQECLNGTTCMLIMGKFEV